MKFYKQIDNNSFEQVGDLDADATHFVGNDGKIRDIVTKQLVSNVPKQTHSEEPLVAPTMNFGDEQKEKTNKPSAEQPLTVPMMNFEN